MNLNRLFALGITSFVVSVSFAFDANAALLGWQTQANNSGAVYSGINLTTPGNNINVAIPAVDETTNGGVTYEFIVNADGASTPSGTMMGANFLAATDRGAYKFEQWNDTGNYGVTQFAVADYNSGIAHTSNEDVHIVYVNNGASTDLYVNGVFVINIAGAAVELYGGAVGIGGTWTGGGYSEPLDGSVLGAAVYDGALSANEIAQHYNTFIPEPASIGLLGLGTLLVLRRRQR